MRKARLLVFLSLLVSTSGFAGPYGDALGKCLVSSTSPAEKTTLIRWMFATLSLHPDVQSMSAVSLQQRTSVNKDTARLFEKLLTVSCARETKEAVKYEGATTIESAFSLLGQVAMRELFANPRVAAGLEEWSKGVDQDKLKKVLGTEQ